MWHTIQLYASLLLMAFLAVGSAADPSIGVAKARGHFRVDGAQVYRNSTVFDGTAVDTGIVAAELEFANGARLLLVPSSSVKVYRDRAVLEKGAAELKGSGSYPLEARTLRIVQANPYSKAQVTLRETNQVQVAALAGTVQVANAQGFVVANLKPGSALNLNPLEAAPLTEVSGRLEQKNGRFIVTDETTNITVELQGDGLQQEVGNVVAVTGVATLGPTPAADATQIIRVSKLDRVGGRKRNRGAAMAIVGGVAATATGVSIWALGLLEDEKLPVSP